jgi:hypothetical protein
MYLMMHFRYKLRILAVIFIATFDAAGLLEKLLVSGNTYNTYNTYHLAAPMRLDGGHSNGQLLFPSRSSTQLTIQDTQFNK